MPFNFNTKYIFETPEKSLKTAFENLKESSGGMDVLKYREMYKHKPLSFILENSRYIFAEPREGFSFYSNLINNAVIPLTAYESEMLKVESFMDEFSSKMSNNQKERYMELQATLESKYNNKLNHSIEMYSYFMEDENNTMMDIYNNLYEYQTTGNENAFESVVNFFENNSKRDVIDAVILGINESSLYPYLYNYLNDCYIENANTANDYKINSMTNNILRRMMKDSDIKESVNSCNNMNLRHFIQGLSNVNQDQYMIESFSVKVMEKSDPHYTSPEMSVNRIFDDELYSEILAEENASEKLNILECKKAILDITKAFAIVDECCDFEYIENPIIQEACYNDPTIEKIPVSSVDQLSFLEKELDKINSEIESINEQYFSNDFGPSKVIANSIATNKEHNDPEIQKPENFSPEKDEKDDESNSDDTKDDSSSADE